MSRGQSEPGPGEGASPRRSLSRVRMQPDAFLCPFFVLCELLMSFRHHLVKFAIKPNDKGMGAEAGDGLNVTFRQTSCRSSLAKVAHGSRVELFVFRFKIGLLNDVHIELVPNRFGNQPTAPITADLWETDKQRERDVKESFYILNNFLSASETYIPHSITYRTEIISRPQLINFPQCRKLCNVFVANSSLCASPNDVIRNVPPHARKYRCDLFAAT